MKQFYFCIFIVILFIAYPNSPVNAHRLATISSLFSPTSPHIQTSTSTSTSTNVTARTSKTFQKSQSSIIDTNIYLSLFPDDPTFSQQNNIILWYAQSNGHYGDGSTTLDPPAFHKWISHCTLIPNTVIQLDGSNTIFIDNDDNSGPVNNDDTEKSNEENDNNDKTDKNDENNDENNDKADGDEGMLPNPQSSQNYSYQSTNSNVGTSYVVPYPSLKATQKSIIRYYYTTRGLMSQEQCSLENYKSLYRHQIPIQRFDFAKLYNDEDCVVHFEPNTPRLICGLIETATKLPYDDSKCVACNSGVHFRPFMQPFSSFLLLFSFFSLLPSVLLLLFHTIALIGHVLTMVT